MYRFDYEKHFDRSRNFEPPRRSETKGFDFFFKIKLLQAMLNQEEKKYFNLIISHFSKT